MGDNVAAMLKLLQKQQKQMDILTARIADMDKRDHERNHVDLVREGSDADEGGAESERKRRRSPRLKKRKQEAKRGKKRKLATRNLVRFSFLFCLCSFFFSLFSLSDSFSFFFCQEEVAGTPVKRGLSFEEAMSSNRRVRQRKSDKLRKLRKRLGLQLSPHMGDVMEGDLWDEQLGRIAEVYAPFCLFACLLFACCVCSFACFNLCLLVSLLAGRFTHCVPA